MQMEMDTVHNMSVQWNWLLDRPKLLLKAVNTYI